MDTHTKGSVYDGLDDLYEGVFAPEVRERFLTKLADDLSANGIHAFARDCRSGEIRCSALGRVARDAKAEYRSTYYADDMRMSRLLEREDGIYPDQMLTTAEERRKSPLHQEYLRKYRCEQTILAVTAIDQATQLVVAIGRDRQRPYFGAEEVRRLELVLPHLRQSFRLGLRQRAMQVQADDLHAVLELSRFGLILVDAEQRVVRANSAAEAMLKRGSPLRVRAGRVQAASPGDRSQVATLIDAALTGASSITDITERSVRLPVADGHSLLLYIAPFSTAYPRMELPRARAALFVVDPRRARADRRQSLHRLYGLTAAESHLAELLCDGLSLAEAAERLGKRVSTLRTHLGNLLNKTGTKRQGQLIAILEREFALFDLLSEPHDH